MCCNTRCMGDSLDFVDYLVTWESPTSGQMVIVKLGSRDPDTLRDGNHNGFFNNDRVNPYYIAYGDTSSEIEYWRIAFDPSYSLSDGIFLDGI